MADRKDIRSAFYSELEESTSGLVDPSNITGEYPDNEEVLPAIVHDDMYRSVPMNRGVGIVNREVDTENQEVTLYYAQQMEARFDVSIFTESESVKEDIYESVRRHFERYKTPAADPSTIQTDIYDVGVGDANSDDTTDRAPPMRGDVVTVDLSFQRFFSQTVSTVEEVNTGVDVDNDSEFEINYTFTN